MKVFLAVLFLSAVMSAHSSYAARIDVFFNEVGDDVVASFEGSVDLANLIEGSGGGATAALSTGQRSIQFPVFAGTVYQATNTQIVDFTNANPPTTFFANTPLGDGFAITTTAPDIFYFLDSGYVSGELISGSMIFTNHTVGSLGLAPGFFFSQINQDNALAITIGDAAAIPLPAAFPMLLGALIALVVTARRSSPG